MLNEIYLEEKECENKETGETFKFVAIMWRFGSQVFQLKPVFKSDNRAIKTLADTGSIEFKKIKEVK